MHVPKCAGSSVIHALVAAFPPGSRAPQFFDDATFGIGADYAALAPELRAAVAVGEAELAALAAHRLVCGHFTLPSLLRVAAPDRIATVLREPRARLLSLYAYWAVGDFSHLAPYAPQAHAERPLGEFLAEPAVASATDNQLCRLVLHGDPRIPGDGFIAAAAADALAADAIAQLERIGFVAIHETPDALWRGLSRSFGVKLEPARVNVTDELPGVPRCPAPQRSIDMTALELLDCRAAVDQQIYRHFAIRDPAIARSPARFEDAALARQLVTFGSLLTHR